MPLAPGALSTFTSGNENWVAYKNRQVKGVIAPLALLVAIVGGIYSGAITPMEASAVGATGAFICTAIYHCLS